MVTLADTLVWIKAQDLEFIIGSLWSESSVFSQVLSTKVSFKGNRWCYIWIGNRIENARLHLDIDIVQLRLLLALAEQFVRKQLFSVYLFWSYTREWSDTYLVKRRRKNLNHFVISVTKSGRCLSVLCSTMGCSAICTLTNRAFLFISSSLYRCGEVTHK